MTQTTVYRSMNGKDCDRADQALREDFLTLQKRLAEQVERLRPSPYASMQYEEDVKALRGFFKRCIEAGREYILESQAWIERHSDEVKAGAVERVRQQVQELKQQQEQAA